MYRVELPTWRLFVPSQAVGTSVVFFDLFNATGSASHLLVQSVIPVVSGAVAISGVIAVDVFLTRTSAVGTGGTAATQNGAGLTTCTFSDVGTGGGPLSPSITARLTPSGGATAGAVLAQASLFTEETNAGTYAPPQCMVRRGMIDVPPIEVIEGTGVRVVQNAVASLGNIGFDILFQVKAR